jgi:hypothetical protein
VLLDSNQDLKKEHYPLMRLFNSCKKQRNSKKYNGYSEGAVEDI